MTTNKEIILNFIQEHSLKASEHTGITTQFIANQLNIQRSNISSILNQLVREGAIEKSYGRPVYYYCKSLSHLTTQDTSCFNQLIGCDGSLKNVIQIAKAAILYPSHYLNTLIIGETGSGKTQFAKTMFQFAKDSGVLSPQAEFIRFNCAHYKDQPEVIDQLLFIEPQRYLISENTNNCYFIDQIELVPSHTRKKLFDLVERSSVDNPSEANRKTPLLICAMDSHIEQDLLNHFVKYFSIKIELPRLEDMSIPERLQLVQHFLTLESIKSKKGLVLPSELMTSLLLYDCDHHIKQLKRDIQLGCANAYVRHYNNQENVIELLTSDFPPHIRQGFLNLRKHHLAVKQLISSNHHYTFSGEQKPILISKADAVQKRSLYEFIDEKACELKERGIKEQDIHLILSLDIENAFQDYSQHLERQISDTEQLYQIVDKKLIELVKQFLIDAGTQLNRHFPQSYLFSICLHLNASLQRDLHTSRLSSEQMVNIIKDHSTAYRLSQSFVQTLEATYQMKLPIDEVIFLTLFLTKDYQQSNFEARPVVLVAMHGNSVAKSVVEIVNQLSSFPAYAFDMPMAVTPDEAIQNLRALILDIHKGKGIFALYDMGSFRNMFDLISEETGIAIEYMEVPLSLLALEANRKAFLGMDVKGLKKSLQTQLMTESKSKVPASSTSALPKAIISLCMSGEGAAVQTIGILEKQINLDHIELIPLAISDKSKLVQQLKSLSKKYDLLCIIGTFNPQVSSLPFIPSIDVYQGRIEEIKYLITDQAKPMTALERHAEDEDFKVVIEHLCSELKHTDIALLKDTLNTTLRNLELSSSVYLAKRQILPLMIHLACFIDQYKSGNRRAVKPVEVSAEQMPLFEATTKALTPISEAFNVPFERGEVANILSIIEYS